MNPDSAWDDNSSYSQQNLFDCMRQLHHILYDPPKFQIIELFSSYLGPLHNSVPRAIPGSEQSCTWSGRETSSRGWEFAPKPPSPFQPLCSLISRGGKNLRWDAGFVGRLTGIIWRTSRSQIEGRMWPPAASASPASCLHGQKWEC